MDALDWGKMYHFGSYQISLAPNRFWCQLPNMICYAEKHSLAVTRRHRPHYAAMTKSARTTTENVDVRLGLAIKAAREEMGLTQAQAASMLPKPVVYQSWQNWEMGRGLTQGRLIQIAETLNTTVPKLNSTAETDLVGDGQRLLTYRQSPRPSDARMIPLYGFVAAAGERIALNDSGILRHIPMHPAQVGYPNAGAAEVVGESMLPRYRPREIVYWVATHPSRGDDVAVEISDGSAIIKEYDGTRQGRVWLREYHPEERLISFPSDEVVNMCSIVGRG
jgi:DNA-binding transcriptional regulator YiaG